MDYAPSASAHQAARHEHDNDLLDDPELIAFDTLLASSLPPSSPVLSPLTSLLSEIDDEYVKPSVVPHMAAATAEEYSSDHVNWSSPILGRNRAERSASKREKLNNKRQKTRDEKAAARARERETRGVSRRLQMQEAGQRARAAEHEASVKKTEDVKDVLRYMKGMDVTYGDILLFMSDIKASSGYGQDRFAHFFAHADLVTTVLQNWVGSGNSITGRKLVKDWAVGYVSTLVSREGDQVTKAGVLQSTKRSINRSFALDFNLQHIHHDLSRRCPNTTRILHALASTTSRRQTFDGLEDGSVVATARLRHSKARCDKFVGSALLTMLRSRSQRNSYTGHVLGLYLYATGAQRQVISVLSHLGLSSSYPTIAGTRNSPGSGKKSASIPQTVLQIHPSSDDSDDSDYQPESSDLDLLSSDWEDVDDTEQEGGTGSSVGDGQSTSRNAGRLVDPADMTPTTRAVNVEAETRPLLSSMNAASGLLQNLSNSSREALRSTAQSTDPNVGPLANVYDNINFMVKAAEQVMGRKDSQENGTCATAFSLYGASREHMKTADLLRSFENAPPLSFKDIRLDTQENEALRERLVWTVMETVVQHGGESFKKFRGELTRAAPPSSNKIPVHKTDIFPMPAMYIDESSTAGNAEVLDVMYRELGYDLKSPKFTDEAKIVFGDQLSMARVRAVTNTRIGHDEVSQTYLNVVFAPGFFHYQMAGTQGVLETHWGDPSMGARDPGSLSFHNDVLTRKPIVLSSLPPYRTCRDLIFVSLYARVLHCLELVSDRSIADYADAMSFADLRQHATAIVDTYANPRVLSERQAASEPGDTVFDNAVLFLRDSLILRHFANSIKAGKSDHLVTVLKLWALGFRAMGRTKYAHELLHLIHNITHLWPAELRNIVMRNWLINPTGHVDSFIPVDLLQEHLNFWIKVIYLAHGSNASWEWLEMISPCIDILRQLASQINAELGSHQGDKHHTPDLARDIEQVMRSLRFHSVYAPDSARPDVVDVKPVPNVYTSGLQALAGPLAEYNATFVRLKEQRAMKPVIGQSALQTYCIPRRHFTPSLSESPTNGILPATTEGTGDTRSAGAASAGTDNSESSESGLEDVLDSGSSSDEGASQCDFGDLPAPHTLDNPELFLSTTKKRSLPDVVEGSSDEPDLSLSDTEERDAGSRPSKRIRTDSESMGPPTTLPASSAFPGPVTRSRSRQERTPSPGRQTRSSSRQKETQARKMSQGEASTSNR
ncbi:hypothetical protein C2E23DRAFT_884097 [Lenzites betulinus]|nr:hypothetical protein C2E23DRAFT_884097 [Lenzites betulinus]